MKFLIRTKEIGYTLAVCLVPWCQANSATADNPAFTEPAAGIHFTQIKGGCFEMGSATVVKLELGRLPKGARPDEHPAHQVCLDSYWLGTYEITREQWYKVMGGKAPATDELNLPKPLVSKDDASFFLKTLNSQQKASNRQFRLPSEAEWEYACLAGGTDIMPDSYEKRSDLQQYAWYAEPSREEAASRPRGEMQANQFGIFDMLGNLWELTSDQYSSQGYGHQQTSSADKLHAIRGGSYTSNRYSVRCKARNYIIPNDKLPTVGLRLVMEEKR